MALYRNHQFEMNKRNGSNGKPLKESWGQSEELLNDNLENQIDELGDTVSSLKNVFNLNSSEKIDLYK